MKRRDDGRKNEPLSASLFERALQRSGLQVQPDRWPGVAIPIAFVVTDQAGAHATFKYEAAAQRAAFLG